MQVPAHGKTVLSLMFASSTVLVEKDEIEFTFDDLVADCGGVLGLFIGFNFLMVWDMIFFIFKNFLKKSSIKYI